jgi:hypothetical protein
MLKYSLCTIHGRELRRGLRGVLWWIKLQELILVKLFLKNFFFCQKSLWNSGAHYTHMQIILDKRQYISVGKVYRASGGGRVLLGFLGHKQDCTHSIFVSKIPKCWQFWGYLYWQFYGQLQGTLTEVEGSVQCTSLHKLVWISCFWYCKHYILFYKTSYLNEEVNCTEPSPSVSVPWQLNRDFLLRFHGKFRMCKRTFSFSSGLALSPPPPPPPPPPMIWN